MEAERPIAGGGQQGGVPLDTRPAIEAENVNIIDAEFSDHEEAGSSSAEEEGAKASQPDRCWLLLQSPKSAFCMALEGRAYGFCAYNFCTVAQNLLMSIVTLEQRF